MKLERLSLDEDLNGLNEGLIRKKKNEFDKGLD